MPENVKIWFTNVQLTPHVENNIDSSGRYQVSLLPEIQSNSQQLFVNVLQWWQIAFYMFVFLWKGVEIDYRDIFEESGEVESGEKCITGVWEAIVYREMD